VISLRARRPLVAGALLGLFVMLLAEVLGIFAGTNFHAVVPHRCYRCGQPTPTSLGEMVRGLGIRTVVNLRGDNNDEEPWFPPEVAAAEALGVHLVHVGLSAYTPPSGEALRELIRALDNGPEPLLLHCHSGSDRTGLASAVYLLLRTDTPLEVAQEQIHPRYGHNPWGGAACQRLVLAQYADWLRAHGYEHRSERLRQWAWDDYDE